MKICKNCQAQLEDNAAVCPFCDQPVEETAENTAEAAEETAAAVETEAVETEAAEAEVNAEQTEEAAAEDIAENAEAAVEDIAENAEAAEVAAEDATENTEAAASDAAEETVETVSGDDDSAVKVMIDDPEGTIELSLNDAAGDAVEDLDAAAGDAEGTDGAAAAGKKAKKPKKKNHWSVACTISVIAAAIICLGVIGYWGYTDGWLKDLYEKVRPKTKSSCTIEDYSTIEIASSAVEITDEEIDYYVESYLGTDEPTDADVVSYCEQYNITGVSTVDEFRTYLHDDMYDYYLNNAIISALTEKTTVNSYDETLKEDFITYAAEYLDNYASNYSMSADDIASYYGYSSAEEYETAMAENYLTTIMVIDKVMSDNKLTSSDEDLDAYVQKYLDENGGSSYYTVDQFKELNGETGMYLFEYLEYKSDIVTQALKDRVVFVEETENDTEAADSTEAESSGN